MATVAPSLTPSPRAYSLPEIAEAVTLIVAQAAELPVNMDTNISVDLDFDSLDYISLQQCVESAFGITIPDGDMFKITTVGQLVRYVDAYLKDKHSRLTANA